MAKLHVQWYRNCFKIILYDVLSANVWFVCIFYIPIPFVLCRNSLGERELGWEGSRRVALAVFPVVLSCKQSSTEHQSSTENRNRPSSASFQRWENRPGPRTLGLQSGRKLEKQCWGAGALWEVQCQILYVQIAEGVRCCLVSPPFLVFGWEF